MARVKDITDKLSFDGNPCLVIKGNQIEVNGDAPTVLKIMGIMSGDGDDMDHLVNAYKLLFPEKSREEIDALKLSVNDWVSVVEEAMNIVMEDDSQGEQ